MATKVTNGLDLSSQKIVNVADPTANQDAATKKYVDDNAGGAVTTVDVITATQTGGSGWLLPTGAKSVHVICIGGGGGGGGGSRNTVSTAAGGISGGGGGGGRVEATIPATLIGTPGTTRIDVTIGAGGSGGLGQTAGSASTNGTDGGTTSFGSFVYALGGKLGTRGNTTVGGTNGSGAYVYDAAAPYERVSPYNGGSASLITTLSIFQDTNAATGGGGGGAQGIAGVTPRPGNNGSPIYLNSSGLTGSENNGGSSTTSANTAAGDGGDGTSRSGSGYCGGGGGGGGANNASTGTTGRGGDGGNGGTPGGGGGGGGASRSTSTRGGDAGDGGRGEVIITVYY